MKQRLCFIGNCQTIAYCKFVRELSSNIDAYWICFRENWIKDHTWPISDKIFGSEQIKFNIINNENNIGVDMIQNSDFIFFQPEFGILEILNKYISQKNDKIKTIAISPIKVNDMDYMIRKEQKYQCKILVSDLVKIHKEKHKLYTDQDNHITTFLILQVVRKICDILDINFYNDQTYKELLKTQYPYY